MMKTIYGFSHDEADQATTHFLQSFRSCPDNTQTSLESWRSYLWSQALPNNFKHLNHIIYRQWLQLRYRYLSLTSEYVSLLKTLRDNYRLGLITNGPSNAQWEKIQNLNVNQLFDCILVSADYPWEKPNPNIFLTACKLLNVKPNECIMIGDKLETDIQGGIEAKLAGTVWIPLKSDEAEELADTIVPKPDIIVKNLMEILQYLPKSNSGNVYNNNNNNNNNFNPNSRRHYHRSASSTGSGISGKPKHYDRVSSLQELDSNSENSSDSCYS